MLVPFLRGYIGAGMLVRIGPDSKLGWKVMLWDRVYFWSTSFNSAEAREISPPLRWASSSMQMKPSSSQKIVKDLTLIWQAAVQRLTAVWKMSQESNERSLHCFIKTLKQFMGNVNQHDSRILCCLGQEITPYNHNATFKSKILSP